ncbi:ATP-binding protein [Streptomyces sp. S07_1.15]|uniref:ATP-binding protein n=1 Tax=Streptomyces sp. S07_1.15 TaxID=2873925 RepID=UPI001D13C31E|nr:ATP-binding protein [Streptomyces sp. S07_1.15]MCC3653720.1 ATP-binding protein [Streptomyces sp. S07_1.15]
MLELGAAETRTRSVIVFAAEATQLQKLRSLVREQLAQWDLPALAEEIQLTVTELVTNVIKHVGAGSAATLILEQLPDRVRVEVHDESRELPVLRDADCDSECGRGLHLIAAMASDCAAVLTSAGKVVWCEFVLVPAYDRSRVDRATAALQSYCDAAGVRVSFSSPPRSLPLMEELAFALMSDLLHCCAARGGDGMSIVERLAASWTETDEADWPSGECGHAEVRDERRDGPAAHEAGVAYLVTTRETDT